MDHIAEADFRPYLLNGHQLVIARITFIVTRTVRFRRFVRLRKIIPNRTQATGTAECPIMTHNKVCSRGSQVSLKLRRQIPLKSFTSTDGVTFCRLRQRAELSPLSQADTSSPIHAENQAVCKPRIICEKNAIWKRHFLLRNACRNVSTTLTKYYLHCLITR
jgi:hypothetical protein